MHACTAYSDSTALSWLIGPVTTLVYFSQILRNYILTCQNYVNKSFFSLLNTQHTKNWYFDEILIKIPMKVIHSTIHVVADLFHFIFIFLFFIYLFIYFFFFCIVEFSFSNTTTLKALFYTRCELKNFTFLN